MIVEIVIREDDGTVKAKMVQDAMHPQQFRVNTTDNPIIGPSNDPNFNYQIFGFTYQPHLKIVDRDSWPDATKKG